MMQPTAPSMGGIEPSYQSFPSGIQERQLPSIDTVTDQLKKQRAQKETISTAGQWILGGSLTSAIVLGTTAGILAATALLSNPVGWGVLAGLSGIAFVGGLVGIALVAMHSEHKVKDICKALINGALLGVVLAMVSLHILLIVGEIKSSQRGGNNFGFIPCFMFIPIDIGPVIPFPEISDSIKNPNAQKLLNSRTEFFYQLTQMSTEMPSGLEAFLLSQFAEGVKLVKEENRHDVIKEYKQAVELVKKHNYSDACAVLWYTYSLLKTDEDKNSLLNEIAALTIKTKQTNNDYFSKSYDKVAYCLLSTLQNCSDPMIVLNYAFLQKLGQKKGDTHAEDIVKQSKNLLEQRYYMAKNEPNNPLEKKFVELFENL